MGATRKLAPLTRRLRTLTVDGKPVASGRVERTIPIRLTYDVPFKFIGKIEKVTIDLN